MVEEGVVELDGFLLLAGVVVGEGQAEHDGLRLGIAHAAHLVDERFGLGQLAAADEEFRLDDLAAVLLGGVAGEDGVHHFLRVVAEGRFVGNQLGSEVEIFVRGVFRRRRREGAKSHATRDRQAGRHRCPTRLLCRHCSIHSKMNRDRH